MHVTPKVWRKGICYVKPVQDVLSVCSHEIPNWIWDEGQYLFCRRRIAGNPSHAQKWYRRDQDSQSRTIELGEPWYIKLLCRLGNLWQPVDNNKEWIVARVLSIVRHRQFHLSRNSHEPTDDDKNQNITCILPMT